MSARFEHVVGPVICEGTVSAYLSVRVYASGTVTLRAWSRYWRSLSPRPRGSKGVRLD